MDGDELVACRGNGAGGRVYIFPGFEADAQEAGLVFYHDGRGEPIPWA